jgi:hypothetical protein
LAAYTPTTDETNGGFMNKPEQGLEEAVRELPEKGPDAAEQFTRLLEDARRVQREKGFSSKADDGKDEPGSA